jgi:hypothetical protein
MTYETLKKIGDKVSAEIARKSKELAAVNPANAIKKVYITSIPPNSGNNQAMYSYVKYSIDSLVNAYESQPDFVNTMGINNIRNNVAFSPETFSDMANAAATTLALFRTSITSSPTALAPDNLGFLPQLSTALLNAKITPVVIDISLDSTVLTRGNSLVHALTYAARLRSAGAAYSAKTPAAANKPAIDVLNISYDNLSTNLMSQSLGNLVQLDFLRLISQQVGNYVLYVTNSYSIGEVRVKSNPLVDIFFDGPRTSFIGGAGVSYFLFQGENFDIVMADHLDGYQGYKRFSKSAWPMVPNALTPKKNPSKTDQNAP